MGGRGASLLPAHANLTGIVNGKISPLITAGLAELRGNEADPESTLRRIDNVRFNKLGHEQLFVVDREGFVITGYDGGRSSVSFPVEKAAEWKDHIVTHRHPGSFGGTFSTQDIGCAVTYGWSEVEASTNEGRYNLKRTRDAKGVELLQKLQKEMPSIRNKMTEISNDIAKRRSQMTPKEYAYENRKRQLKVLDDWYSDNLPKHGYIYTFTPREEQGND